MKSVKNVDKMLFPGRANRMNLKGGKAKMKRGESMEISSRLVVVMLN